MASLKYHFKTSIGHAFIFLVASIFATILAIFYHRFAAINLYPPLDYSNLESIYSSVTPIDLYYNTMVEDTGESTSEFMTTIQNVAGPDTLNLVGQDWPKKNES